MSFASLLESFKGLRAVVIGDVMLDEYIFGRAARISPEAPVIVLDRQSDKALPGGAANVALNLKALGAETSIIGLVGADESADKLRAALADAGLPHTLVADPTRVTSRKTRIVAEGRHQMLRIDNESRTEPSEVSRQGMLKAAAEAIVGADVIVISDYLKGTVFPALIASLMGKAPVACNPKPRSAALYPGAELVSLNRREAVEILDAEFETIEACDVAETLRAKLKARTVLVTLGEAGMAAAHEGGGAVYVEAPRVEVADPAGAGDTVIATAALGLVAAGFRREVFELAARTSACVVGHVGVATPSAADLAAIISGE